MSSDVLTRCPQHTCCSFKSPMLRGREGGRYLSFQLSFSCHCGVGGVSFNFFLVLSCFKSFKNLFMACCTVILLRSWLLLLHWCFIEKLYNVILLMFYLFFVERSATGCRALPVGVICGVGGVGFCILLEGAPHFALTGETATAMLAVLLSYFVIVFNKSICY